MNRETLAALWTVALLAAVPLTEMHPAAGLGAAAAVVAITLAMLVRFSKGLPERTTA